MSHDRDAFELQLSELLDGRLAEDEARALREHLDSCDECRARYAELVGALEVLRATPRPTVPPGLLQEIQHAAEAEMAQAQPTVWQRWRYTAAGLAAAGHTPADGPATAVVAEEQAGGLGVPVPDSAVAEAPAAEATVAYAAASAPAEGAGRVERVRGRDSTSPPAASGQLTPSRGQSAVALADSASQPALAMAPAPARASVASGPVLGEAAGRELAHTPRMTVADEPQEPRPSDVEVEMAGGVIAAMLLDQYVATNMVQSSAAIVSLITDTPALDYGPALAREDDEAGGFSLCFTDAMRAAFAESENRIP